MPNNLQVIQIRNDKMRKSHPWRHPREPEGRVGNPGKCLQCSKHLMGARLRGNDAQKLENVRFLIVGSQNGMRRRYHKACPHRFKKRWGPL